MSSTKFLDVFQNVDDYKQTICAKVIDVIRTSNRLAFENFDQLMKIDSCREKLEFLNKRILNRIYKLKSHVQSTNWDNLDINEQLEQLVDVNDTLFEQIASALDEADGIKKTVLSTVVRQVFVKPQLNFKYKIDNNPDIPFIPKIRDKPNSVTPLPKIFTEIDFNKINIDLLTKDHELFQLLSQNLYHNEIEAFCPNEKQLKSIECQFPKSIEQTNYLFVDNIEKLNIMLNHIEIQSEIAIDLEHHSYRSYQGFTCLMQISSRTQDFIVDTLILRDDLSILNNVFTNPHIVKVFHGADWDIEWLQKDFGIYIVNMFDTHLAAKELSLPSLSLAYLLKIYCHVDANKQYQLADWRIRPLPDEYVRYAREDTHYLLYISDCLRNQLLEIKTNDDELLKIVYAKSKVICQKLYIKPMFDENAFKILYFKSHKINFDGSQLAVLKTLYSWRDKIAREEDESTSYTLPDLILIQLAEFLPKDIQDIRKCCKLVPELVEKYIEDIHRLILQAIKNPITLDLNDEEYLQSKRSISTSEMTNLTKSSYDRETKRTKLTSDS